MKNSKKNFGFAGQSKTEQKVLHKHDTNLQKNSTLYFQIGLILCLLATYALFEMQFQKQQIVMSQQDYGKETSIDVATVFRLEPKMNEQQKSKLERATQLTETYTAVENFVETAETKLVTPEENNLIEAYHPSNITDIEDTTNTLDDIFIGAVQVVPIFPGCEKYSTNEKRKKCMSKKIGKLINKKFNTEIGSEYGIVGKQKIYTQFTIDSNGEVSDIKVRGPHPALEKEAQRVISKIPKMQPGLQQDKPVGVIYTLPITFLIKQ
ncbi:energy transducer TonB [Winogradskyella sp. DF17]|uniref:Energy transducer TonB n=1 Tax=Winogradskyella pelagia TaxID=2819984 RepID=A0ABS3T1E7_9FLAO|nr:energy transducer TonB [Winogradskyella sp. DF17]MBO3115555.1 energy transducer TonB [Winogradskyella sp. DF17]